jgi:hypothetical protein
VGFFVTLNSNNSNSFEFTGYLLLYRLNTTSAYYKARANTQIKHENSTNRRKQSTKQQNSQREEYKSSTGAKTLYPKKPTDKLISKCYRLAQNLS